VKPITLKQLKELETLAETGRPLDDDDYGSERQVDAENLFWFKLHDVFGDGFGEVGLGEDFDRWCLKATTEEMLDEALKLIDKRFWETCSGDDRIARDCEELEAVDRLDRLKDGPVKKFQIMKRFGTLMRTRGGYTLEQLKRKSCKELREVLREVTR